MEEKDIYPKTKGIRDLCFWVAPNQTWTDHLKKITDCYKLLAMLLRNLPEMLNPDMEFQWNRIHVLQALAHASGVWYPNRANLKKLNGLQRICFKRIDYRSSFHQVLLSSSEATSEIHLWLTTHV